MEFLGKHARRPRVRKAEEAKCWSGFYMKVVENRRERYPNSLERSNWAQKGPKTEQKVLECYTKIGVALPAC